MKRPFTSTCCAATLLAVLVLPSFAATELPNPRDNAALRYWQAFALMPQAKEHQEIIGSWDAVSLGGPTAEMLKSAEYAMGCFRGGAEIARCDWGLNYAEGPELLMPHLARARDLARLALLRARHRFDAGDFRGGIDDATAVFKLAGDVGDPILIALLVQYMIELNAVHAIATDLPKLDPPALEYLAQRLDQSPPRDRLAAVWAVESKLFVGWFEDRVRKVAKETGGSDAEWENRVLSLAIFSREDAEKIRSAGLPDAEKLLEDIGALQRYLAEMEPVTDLPPAEQDARLAELRRKYRDAGTLTKLLLPNTERVFQTRRRWQAQRAMLEAAVAVAREGEAALKQERFADPSGQGPFDYQKTDRGFELRSKLMYEGKPVTLNMGGRQ